jgi:phage shock protein PspC (stress-responsive transcriptional regulator)
MAAMTSEQPGTALHPDGTPSEARRLRRRTTDRVIGGVAGGVADYLNVDPLLPRVAFAGLMIFGGAGLVLYVVAWLLMPAYGRGDSIVQEWLTRLRARVGSTGTAILVVIAVIVGGLWLAGQVESCMVPVDAPYSGQCASTGFGWLIGYEPIRLRDAALIAIAVIVVGIVVLRWREGSARPATAMGGVPAQATAPGAAIETAAEAMPPTAGAINARSGESLPRPRSPLGWYVLAAVLLAVGLLAIVGIAPGLEVALGQYFGAALTVFGIGLVVGAWWGRARLLILLGLFVLPVAAAAALINVPLDGGFADQAFQPKTVGELRTDYGLAGGEIRLDLTDLPAGGGPIVLNASVGVGLLVVVVPDDARLVLDARVSGGRLSLFGNRQIGTGLADRIERLTGLGPQLVLRLEAGIGEVLVQTASDGG